jgi:hypothetical protein
MRICMKGKITAITSVAAILFALTVGPRADAQDVRYNFDKDADFSKYKTYRWVPARAGTQVDELTDKQIKSALDTELAKKGLTKASGDTADLNTSYQVALSEKEQVTLTGTGAGYRRWGGMGTVYGDTTIIPLGALALDMNDASTNNLVWRGVATKEIDPKAKPDKRDKNLAKGVAKLLKNYPPAQEKK